MKSVINLNLIKLVISMLAIITAIFGIFSCDSKDNNEPSVETEFKKTLAGTWSIEGGSAIVDDIEVTDAFTGFSVTFSSDGKYTTANPVLPIWPASGTYTTVYSNSIFTIHRSDEVDITVKKIDQHHLTLSFRYQATNAREQQVTGEYTFNLTR